MVEPKVEIVLELTKLFMHHACIHGMSAANDEASANRQFPVYCEADFQKVYNNMEEIAVRLEKMVEEKEQMKCLD